MQFQNELVVLSRISNNHQVEFIEAFFYQNTYFVVLEVIDEERTMLRMINRSNGGFNEEFCKYTLHCVAKAI